MLRDESMPALLSTLKRIDATVGSLVAKLLPMPAKRNLLISRKFLVIRPGGIGDAVLLMSSIRSIRDSFPDAFIAVLAEKRNSAVFSMCSEVNEVFNYDCAGDLIYVLLHKYDVVIDTEQWYYLSAVIARLVRSPVKIGFGTNERRRMFTHDIPYDMDVYEADNFLALLKSLGVDCQRGIGTVTLKLTHESLAKADQLLQSLCSKPFVVVLPGSSMPEKCWGADRFSSVSRHLEEEGYKVVVVGGREDHADGELIAGAAGLNLAGKTTLPETAAVLARSRLVICGDSGVLHIAAGLGVPTVSLFGPSSEVKWAPRGDNHVVLNRHVPCSPCSRFGTIPPCPINVRCMKEITPEEVVEAARRLLLQPPEQKV